MLILCIKKPRYDAASTLMFKATEHSTVQALENNVDRITIIVPHFHLIPLR